MMVNLGKVVQIIRIWIVGFIVLTDRPDPPEAESTAVRNGGGRDK